MNKIELREFTRKCAEEKVRYTGEIERLNEYVKSKDQRI
jgi:hypothetical protein